MNAEERTKEIFSQALERKSPGERENFLAEACKDEPEMRSQVESLLRAHEQAGDFLSQTIKLPPADFELEPPGTMIGRYKLLEKIGEGGFGVVYMAEQQEPVQRKVALKIIKPGMDTREVTARFEAERQALALMDHPNIARVLDGGATEAGRPYFVMELVRGTAVTDYCDQNNLTTTERLQLFMKVCHAVQHAHQKAVIHRDLKPSNILVTLHDGEPVPKVIDFGVAKALGQKLTERTLFTAFRQMIGTPAYMAPEQAEMSGVDIDTRSDIYSLGVLLYELLTGVTPFDREILAKAALDEIRRMIREREPPKPSTRLRTLGDKLTDVAKHRHTEPAALSRLLRGDLDWIVMKCLEKDRQRRYETANGLARDIQRHFADEPVIACAPSKLYRFQKMVRRNKFTFTAASAISLTLIIGVGVSTWLFLKEGKARRRAIAAEQDQTRLRREADARRVETSGDLLVSQGKWKEAITSRREALALWQQARGFESLDAANALDKLVGALATQASSRTEAETLCRELLTIRRRLLGDENPDVVRTLSYLAGMLRYHADGLAESEKLRREAVVTAPKVWGAESWQAVLAVSDLADVLFAEGKLAEAEALYRDVVQRQKKQSGDKRPEYESSLERLAEVLSAEGKLADAEAISRQEVENKKKLLGFGNEDASVASSVGRLALLFARESKLQEAEQAYREELAIYRKLWVKGIENRNGWLKTLMGPLRSLVDILWREGKDADIEQVFDDLVAPVLISRPDARLAASLLRDQTEFFARRCRWQEAAAGATKAIEIHPADDSSYHLLAPLLVASGDLEGYREHCQRVLARFGQTKDPVVAERMAKDCLILPWSGTNSAAVAQLANTAVTLGKSHPFIPFFHFCKALAEYRQGNVANAVEWANKTLSEPGVGFRDVQACMVLAMAHYQLKHNDESRAALAKGVEIERAKAPRSDATDLGGDWGDWIIAHALMKEAKALIDGESTPGQRAP